MEFWLIYLFFCNLGYQWEDIRACVEWMSPFAFAMRGSNISSGSSKIFTGVSKDDQHNIQSHSVELSILELAQQRQAYIAAEAENNRNSPDPQMQGVTVDHLEMTPPEEYNSQSSGLDERKRDAKAMVGTPTNYTNLNVMLVQKPHQQSSVFLSPTSDDSGLW